MQLKHLREKIDSIDDELLELFLKRMELCREVAENKIHTKKDYKWTHPVHEVLSYIGKEYALLIEEFGNENN